MKVLTLAQVARELNKVLDERVRTTDYWGNKLTDKLLLSSRACKHDRSNGYVFVTEQEYVVAGWFTELLQSYGYFAEFRDYDTLAIYRI